MGRGRAIGLRAELEVDDRYPVVVRDQPVQTAAIRQVRAPAARQKSHQRHFTAGLWAKQGRELWRVDRRQDLGGERGARRFREPAAHQVEVGACGARPALWGDVGQHLYESVGKAPLTDPLPVALASAADPRGAERSGGHLERSLAGEPLGHRLGGANLRRFGAIFGSKPFAIAQDRLSAAERRRRLDERVAEARRGRDCTSTRSDERFWYHSRR